MVSTRFAPAAAVLLLLALVPTVVHNYLGARVTDGRRAAGIATRLAGLDSRPTGRPEPWARRNFDAVDFVERYYGAGDRLRLLVVRSYDAKKLYHHPELVASYGAGLAPAGSVVLPGDPPIPAFVLRPGRDESQDLVVYALVSRDEVVANPYAYQVRAAGRQLVSGRELLTLIYVHDRAAAGGPLEAEAAAQLLREAVASYLAQPAAPPS